MIRGCGAEDAIFDLHPNFFLLFCSKLMETSVSPLLVRCHFLPVKASSSDPGRLSDTPVPPRTSTHRCFTYDDGQYNNLCFTIAAHDQDTFATLNNKVLNKTKINYKSTFLVKISKSNCCWTNSGRILI